MAENTKPGSTVQPQQTMPKVMIPHSAASNRDSKSDNGPQGNCYLKGDREERQLNSIFNPNIASDTITHEDTYDSLSEIKLEFACFGGNESPKTLTKEQDEATPKSPKNMNPDDHGSHIPSKTEAKSQSIQKSKSIKTAHKGSTDITESSTDLPKSLLSHLVIVKGRIPKCWILAVKHIT